MTIGQHIDKLVEEHGDSTIGLYILEQALVKALRKPCYTLVKLDGRLTSQCSRYQELKAEENAFFARLQADREAEALRPLAEAEQEARATENE